MQYLDKLFLIMDECHRILKDDGSVWINIADSYNGTKRGNTNGLSGTVRQNKQVNAQEIDKHIHKELKRKSLFLVPQRFGIGCVDRGWICRNDIVWEKPNAMPDSAKDRFTVRTETIWFFTKNERYYFNLDPIREKPITEWKQIRKGRRTNTTKLGNRNFMPLEKYTDVPARGSTLHRYRYQEGHKQDNVLGADGKVKATYKGFNERYRNQTVQKDKNPGNVWHINTKPFPEAHFATFPPTLPEKIILCATRPGDTVLDPFAGSGTTMLEAKKLKRNSIGIELSEKYCNMINRRLTEML